MASAELYCDASATTPPLKEVLEAMEETYAHAWANPSSLHGHGLEAAEALERARQRMGQLLGVPSQDLLITSGATESVHLALLGAAAAQQPAQIVISAVEHPAVMAAAESLQRDGWQLTIWPVGPDGGLRMDLLEAMLAPPTRLVSLNWGQSEIGTLQPIVRIGEACRQRGIVLHTDATQLLSQGRPDWSRLPVDLLSGSAHKFRGPRGVGLLLHRPGVLQRPLLGGGGQQGGWRSGTESIALAAGMAEALAALPVYCPEDGREPPPGAAPQLRRWRDRLLDQLLQRDGVHAVGADPDHRLPHHLSLVVEAIGGGPASGRELVRQLSRQGIAASSGSACSSGRSQDSPVLAAIGVRPDLRRSGLRLSLGSWLTDSDLESIPERFDAARSACS